jgi:hypothetical protein
MSGWYSLTSLSRRGGRRRGKGRRTDMSEGEIYSGTPEDAIVHV